MVILEETSASYLCCYELALFMKKLFVRAPPDVVDDWAFFDKSR